MNFIEIVKEIKFDNENRHEFFIQMAKYYEKTLPLSLYQDPYELAELTNISSYYWKLFLKTPQIIQLIESEVAMIAEVKARGALNRLGGENINTSEVAAVKALLEKSKLLQDKMTDRQTIVFHHIPMEETKDE